MQAILAGMRFFVEEAKEMETHGRIKSGEIARSLAAFSAPLILSGILQQLYNWADAFVVGHVEGQLAMGSIGAATSCVHLFVMALTGFTLGLAVLMAQRHGAGEDGEITRSLAAWVFILGGAFLLLGAAGSALAGELLALLDTTDDMLPLATDYLSVVLLGLPFLAVYNTYSAALRSLGDSRAPFLAVLVSSGVNVALDILLVAVVRRGVRGAAEATVASQAAMAVFIALYAVHKHPVLRFRPGRAMSGLRYVAEGLRFGLPPMIQSSVSAAGSLMLQSFMNGFGNDTVTAITTAYRVDTVILLPIINLGSGISTFTAQSVGACDNARAKRVLGVGCLLMTGVSLALMAIVIPSGGYLIALFGADEAVSGLGSRFFACIAPFYVVYGLATAARGYIEGVGGLVYSSCVTIFALAVRIGASYAMKPFFGNMTIAYAEAVSWGVMILLYGAKLLARRVTSRGA